MGPTGAVTGRLDEGAIASCVAGGVTTPSEGTAGVVGPPEGAASLDGVARTGELVAIASCSMARRPRTFFRIVTFMC